MSDANAAYETLYACAWADLVRLRQAAPTAAWLLPEATPVLAYGEWATARLVVAALNPSEDEFQTRDRPRRPLPPDRQRLLPWPADKQLTPARLAEARRRAEGYFRLGHAYWAWFGRYRPLPAALGWSFEDGQACATNWASPYTTTVGWGAVRSAAARCVLAAHGGPLWRQLLEILPQVEIVLGQGAGWRTVPPLFGFTPADWIAVPAAWDTKGGAAAGPRPHLLYHPIRLAGRSVLLAWWRPNRGGALTWLDTTEAARLGVALRALACGAAPNLL